MKRKITLTLLCGFLVGTTLAFAQTQLKGLVVDAKTKTPMPGVTIVVVGTVGGTITRTDGQYSINTRLSLPLTLRVSFIGYKTREAIISTSSPVTIELEDGDGVITDVIVTGNRVEERITKAPVTIEQVSVTQLQQTAAFDSYGVLQNVKGVDLLSQSLLFKSVNLRGFGANNNNRFVQLTDGMDNRSPGLGFGFGNTAGVSDLDIENIEILPGASSALYGPDALQGLMLTKTKSPFEFQGISAQVKTGINNVGKDDISAKPYTDFALRFAKQLSKDFAFKANLQLINGTDFIADDYNDRSTRSRRNFFLVDQAGKTVKFGYTPNNDPSQNFEYDGVNIYGDDITNGGAFDFAANHAVTGLQGKRVTRTGYTELELLGNEGKVFSNRANLAAHYRLNDNIEAIASWNYGNGNLIRTAGFREYFPDYKRNQVRLELRSNSFFVRAYNTTQTAEGYNLGVLAQRILTSWKSTNTWAANFSSAFAANGGNLAAARTSADAGKPLAGSADFNSIRDKLINTLNNATAVTLPDGTKLNGVRLLDNSSLSHVEGKYDFRKFLPKNIDLITGASFRKYDMETQGTIFPLTVDNNEYTITEYGWYTQASVNFNITDKISFKPIVAVRYDKNEYFAGGFTPRVSAVVSVGEHNFRASWQSAFRNPSANQLLADGKIGEVGGSQRALETANLFDNPAYTEASVKNFQTSGNVADLVKYEPKPADFTTEKIKTWEVGYKSLLANRLYVDAFLYRSIYNDFIATQNYIQPNTTNVNDLKSTSTYRVLQVNFNNFNEIFVNGWGLGLEYVLPKGTSISGNYANQVGLITLRDNAGNVRKDAFGAEIVKRRMSEPEVSQVGRNFFISPENRYNISVGNPKVTKSLGFNVSWRWTDEMWVEQGNTQGDIMLPSWSSLDAAISYRIPSLRTIVKVGASNLLNQYYAQGYGLAQIGGMYYVSLNFDEFINR